MNRSKCLSGHLYDRTGTPMEWLAAMAAAYDQRAHCFVHQFNKYSLIKGKNITIEVDIVSY